MKILDPQGNEVFRHTNVHIVWEEFNAKYNKVGFRVCSMDW
jgi:hypothetical protein